MKSLEEYRLAFIRDNGKFLAFPVAGSFIWALVGIVGFILPEPASIYFLLFATGAIFPLALLIARILGQKIFQPGNPFATLMGQAVLMVNVLWALHLVLVFRVPGVAVLSISLALGLHWIIFGWIIQASIGIFHTLARTLLCTGAFLVFADNSVSAVALATVCCYLMTIFQLWRRFPEDSP